MSHTDPIQPQQNQANAEDDPYFASMQKADRRRKLVLLSIGVGLLGSLGLGMISGMQSIVRMNQDLPGVFSGTQEMAAKAPVALIQPPRPPSPLEFQEKEALREEGPAASQETDLSVEVPAPAAEP